MNRTMALCALILLCSGAGCATALRGDSQKMKFESDPNGATVKIADQVYTTPVTVPLKRKATHEVQVSKEGYQPIQFTLRSQWDGASLPNMVAPGGSLMLATDTATGADRNFYTLQKIKLQKLDHPTTAPTVLFERRGKLLTEADYKAAEQKEIDDSWSRMGAQ